MSSQTPPRRCVNADGRPKRSYETRPVAEFAARRTRRDNLRDAAGLMVYRCASCSSFHVGHGDQ